MLARFGPLVSPNSTLLCSAELRGLGWLSHIGQPASPFYSLLLGHQEPLYALEALKIEHAVEMATLRDLSNKCQMNKEENNNWSSSLVVENHLLPKVVELQLEDAWWEVSLMTN